jgi:hypothetical protein
MAMRHNDEHHLPETAGRIVVERAMLGRPMICDVQFIIVGCKEREFGTSSPHLCSAHNDGPE